MLTRNPQRRSGGFTLIELLVVIAVIGILAALLIPTIRGLFVRTDDFQRQVEIDQFSAALEKFKTDYGFYPPDFRYINGPADMLPYLAKISPNHQELQVDPIDGTDTRLQVWWDNVGVVLKDGATGGTGTGPFGHETALWFWLSQLRDNAQFPLTASRNPSDLTLVADEPKIYFEFNQGRLHDITGGGVDYPQGAAVPYQLMHYEQAGGGEAPYIYFHHTSYGNPNNMPGDPGAVHEVIEDGTSLGLVAPYRVPSAAAPEAWPYYNPDTFQIVCAGDDGVYGDVDTPEVLADLEDANGVYFRNPGLSNQRDNISSFSEGRMETIDFQ